NRTSFGLKEMSAYDAVETPLRVVVRVFTIKQCPRCWPLARVMISLSLDLGPPSKTLPHGLLIRHDRLSEIVTMMTFIATSNEEDLLTHEVSDEALEAAGGNEATNFTMAACTFHVGCAG